MACSLVIRFINPTFTQSTGEQIYFHAMIKMLAAAEKLATLQTTGRVVDTTVLNCGWKTDILGGQKMLHVAGMCFNFKPETELQS